MGKPRWKIRTCFNLVCVAFTIVWVVAVVNVFFSDGRSTWSLRSRRPRPAQPQAPSAARYIPIAAQEDGNDSSVALHFAKPDHELVWPPLLLNGTVPDADGADTMPLMDVHVPRFYQPPPSVDLDAVGFEVNGEETIFLMIASYRDFQCRETIASAFDRADHPGRLYVGAVDQTAPGDTGCLDLQVPCEKDPTQALCRHRDRIAVFRLNASLATGPVTARHIGHRLYRGQTYAMQLDAHCVFSRHWDTDVIAQWHATHNRMAVLTSYLSSTEGALTPDGDAARATRPIVCSSAFARDTAPCVLRHGVQPESSPTVTTMPMLQPFWAAGFAFSRGHFVLRVPYDPYLPMLFQGEEISMGVRAFTHGYDFYAPMRSVVFHEYTDTSARRARRHTPLFWEHAAAHAGQGERSLRRALAAIGMAPGTDPASYPHTALRRYGIGHVRPLNMFYRLFLVDPSTCSATSLCPFVNSGGMHEEFQKHLRPDGQGVDYAYLHGFDTAAEIARITGSVKAWLKSTGWGGDDDRTVMSFFSGT